MSTHDAADFHALGGEAGIHSWVQRFYADIARCERLAPLFSDLEESRRRQEAYFVEFFGGPPLYSNHYGRPYLRYRHRHVRIGRPERDAWMRLALESLRAGGAPGALVDAVEMRLAPLAEAMINHDPERHDARYFQGPQKP